MSVDNAEEQHVSRRMNKARATSRTIGMLSLTATLMGGVLVGWVAAQQRPSASKPRVEHKKFAPDDINRVFFQDVFEVLIGSRPPQLDRAPPPSAATSAPPSPSLSGATASEQPGVIASQDWPHVISAATIEDEMKAIKQLVDRDVTNPGEFRGRGYRECRRHFSIAAMLFGIIAEYDGDVRWKNTAAAARDVFARSAANAKVGSPQVFNEAKLRKLDLEDILNGTSLGGAREATAANQWGSIVDRGPLMMRLETAFDERLQPFTANPGEFENQRQRLLHEAEMIAAIASVLVSPELPDGGDSTYDEHAGEMRRGALEVVRAVKANSYEQARQGAALIGQSCSNCHEGYRG